MRVRAQLFSVFVILPNEINDAVCWRGRGTVHTKIDKDTLMITFSKSSPILYLRNP